MTTTGICSTKRNILQSVGARRGPFVHHGTTATGRSKPVGAERRAPGPPCDQGRAEGARGRWRMGWENWWRWRIGGCLVTTRWWIALKLEAPQGNQKNLDFYIFFYFWASGSVLGRPYSSPGKMFFSFRINFTKINEMKGNFRVFGRYEHDGDLHLCSNYFKKLATSRACKKSPSLKPSWIWQMMAKIYKIKANLDFFHHSESNGEAWSNPRHCRNELKAWNPWGISNELCNYFLKNLRRGYKSKLWYHVRNQDLK